MEALTLRLPDDLHEHLRVEAFEKRTSITALILEALAHRVGDARAHSRACSTFPHAHGPHCSTNCPTCGGK